MSVDSDMSVRSSPNRVLVCGSRTSRSTLDSDAIRGRINELPDDTIVVHGGALGVDHWAGFWATHRGLRVEVYRADWTTHGKAAGPIRNRQMLDLDLGYVIAFLGEGESRGTHDTISEAKRRGYLVEIHHLGDPEAAA